MNWFGWMGFRVVGLWDCGLGGWCLWVSCLGFCSGYIWNVCGVLVGDDLYWFNTNM